VNLPLLEESNCFSGKITFNNKINPIKIPRALKVIRIPIPLSVNPCPNSFKKPSS
jgi:hypothetical protein